MLLIELTTNRHQIRKTFAFSNNGVMSLQTPGQLSIFKVNKQEARNIADALMKWSDEQPDPETPNA